MANQCVHASLGRTQEGALLLRAPQGPLGSKGLHQPCAQSPSGPQPGPGSQKDLGSSPGCVISKPCELGQLLWASGSTRGPTAVTGHCVDYVTLSQGSNGNSFACDTQVNRLGSLHPHTQTWDHGASSVMPLEGISAPVRPATKSREPPSPQFSPCTSGERRASSSLDTAFSWLEAHGLSFPQPLGHCAV